MRFPDSRILIFAKAPVAGRVKTRLLEVLEPGQAARLYARLLTRVVSRTVEAEIAPVDLHAASDRDHPLFVALERRYGVPRRLQAGGDLGERMAHAARSALKGCARVVLIGADCPDLDPGYLEGLLARLGDDCPAVLGPAEDGGYVALGLRRFSPRVFEQIDWGSERVLAQTRRRLGELGWRHALTRKLWDLDRPADLDRLRRSHPELWSVDLDQALARDEALSLERLAPSAP